MKKIDNAVKFNVIMGQADLDLISKWRAQQSDLPSRSEAIRRLVKMSLESQGNA